MPITIASPQNNREAERLLEELGKVTEEVKTSKLSFNSKKHDTETRSAIAKKFIGWYFHCLVGSFILLLIYNAVLIFNNKPNHIVDVPDIITLIGSIIGTPLGFVVGYYFKESSDKE